MSRDEPVERGFSRAERIERVMTRLLIRASYDGASVSGRFNDLGLDWAYDRAKQIVDYCDGRDRTGT